MTSNTRSSTVTMDFKLTKDLLDLLRLYEISNNNNNKSLNKNKLTGLRLQEAPIIIQPSAMDRFRRAGATLREIADQFDR